MKMSIKLSFIALVLGAFATTSIGADRKQTQKSNEASRARGLFVSKTSDAMRILVLKVAGGTLVPVDPSNEFKAGDQIKVQFQSNFEGYIYVVNIEPNGKRKVLFPYPDATDNTVRPDVQYYIPPGTAAIEFDKEKGTEVLQVIMSRDRIPYLDAALKEPDQYLSQSAAVAAAELQAGISKKVTPVVPSTNGSKVRSRDIILAPGKDKDKEGSVVAIPDNGSAGGKLKSGEIAPFEIRLKHT
jgi:Domain of unknown function (DUF4384)